MFQTECGPASLIGAGMTLRELNMAGDHIAHFQNDAGHRKIEIGVKEFKCVGANPPFDHPHVYLDMGDDEEIVCSYCSTLYVHNPALKHDETKPEGCVFRSKAA
jgi:uncharacterized Zn-finger protein